MALKPLHEKTAEAATAEARELPASGLVVDSASLYEIVATMNLGDEAYPWARESAEALTTTLLQVDGLRVAGTPGSSSQATGLYGLLLRKIERDLDNVTFEEVAASEEHRAECRTKATFWARKNNKAIRILLTTLLDDTKNFKPWLDHAMALAWNDHSSRLGGLFNQEFLDPIADVLGVSKNEIQLLWDLSKQKAFLGRRQDPDVAGETATAYVIKAYVVSALIRGMFHQFMAEAEGRQLTQHPFRVWAYEQTSGTADTGGTKSEFPVPDPQRLLSHLLVHDALLEDDPERRARKWLKRVADASVAIREIKPDLSPQPSIDHSVALAVQFGAKLDLVPPKRWADRLVTTAQSLGILAATTVVHAAFGAEYDLGQKVAINVASSWVPTEKAKAALQSRLAQRELRQIIRLGAGVVGHTKPNLPKLNLSSGLSRSG